MNELNVSVRWPNRKCKASYIKDQAFYQNSPNITAPMALLVLWMSSIEEGLNLLSKTI